jgi:hypothetical protein
MPTVYQILVIRSRNHQGILLLPDVILHQQYKVMQLTTYKQHFFSTLTISFINDMESTALRFLLLAYNRGGHNMAHYCLGLGKVPVAK